MSKHQETASELSLNTVSNIVLRHYGLLHPFTAQKLHKPWSLLIPSVTLFIGVCKLPDMLTFMSMVRHVLISLWAVFSFRSSGVLRADQLILLASDSLILDDWTSFCPALSIILIVFPFYFSSQFPFTNSHFAPSFKDMIIVIPNACSYKKILN